MIFMSYGAFFFLLHTTDSRTKTLRGRQPKVMYLYIYSYHCTLATYWSSSLTKHRALFNLYHRIPKLFNRKKNFAFSFHRNSKFKKNDYSAIHCIHFTFWNPFLQICAKKKWMRRNVLLCIMLFFYSYYF